MKLGVVGDLSQNDPANLARALDAALAAADYVVQLGDINPGYDVLRARLALNPTRLFCIPGNHDTQGPGNWDAELAGRKKQFAIELPWSILVGIDNSADRIDDEAWRILHDVAEARKGRHLFIALHKPLTPVHLPDGSVTSHIMGGDSGIVCADAHALAIWAHDEDVVFLCGHYHAWALHKPDYGIVILEGRGGAAPPARVYAPRCGGGFVDRTSGDVVTRARPWRAHPGPWPDLRRMAKRALYLERWRPAFDAAFYMGRSTGFGVHRILGALLRGESASPAGGK